MEIVYPDEGQFFNGFATPERPTVDQSSIVVVPEGEDYEYGP